MPRVIAISSQKGGVGKTTTAKELAAAWGESGRGVLVIDADPSFAVTRALGLTSRPDATVYDVMKGDCDVSAATSPASAPGVDVVPGDRRMEALALALVSQFKREEVLARALEGHVSSYDIVVIDTQPGLGQLTVNALCAASEVLIPVAMTAQMPCRAPLRRAPRSRNSPPRGSTCVFERSSRHGPIHHGGSTGNSLSRPTTAARRH